jgi:hypothetical protein
MRKSLFYNEGFTMSFSDARSFDGIHPNFHFDVWFMYRCVNHVIYRRLCQCLRILTFYKFKECQSMVTDFGVGNLDCNESHFSVYWPSKRLYLYIYEYSIQIHAYTYDDGDMQDFLARHCLIELRHIIDINSLIHHPLFKKYFID